MRMRILFSLVAAVTLFTARPIMSQDGASSKRPHFSLPGWVGPGPIKRGDTGPGAGWSYYGLTNGPRTELTEQPPKVLKRYGPTVPTYSPAPLVNLGCERLPRIGYGLWAGGYRSAVPPK